MATDLFNNPSNDYVFPALSPCAGSGSDQYLEFVDNGIGVVSGSKILSYIDFGSIKIPVSAYSVETKIIGEREVIYIPGLTKGLTLRQQGFTMPNTIGDDSTNPLFMQIDLSINYYSGFRFTFSNIDVSANYSQNINIEDALNIALGNLGIKATASYDPSILTFAGTLAGYDFNISNVVLTLIDASGSPFPYPWEFPLEEDVSAKIPASKYPNGGMQGIVMKGIYPTGTPVAPYDHWLYINHVSDSIQYYSPVEIDNYIYNIRGQQINSYDPATTWGPFISDLTINVPEFQCSSLGFSYDPSYGPAGPFDVTLQDVSIWYAWYNDSSISNCEIYYSGIEDSFGIFNKGIHDSSIYGSDVYSTNTSSGGTLIDQNSFVTDSSLSIVESSDSFIQKSWIRNSEIYDSSLACDTIYDSSLGTTDITYSDISNTIISNSNIFQTIIVDSSITSSILKDSSLSNIDISGSKLETVDVSQGYVFETYAKNESYFWNSYIIDSSIIGSVIDSSSFVINSTIELSYSNAYKLITGGIPPYIWVIDDPTLSIDDPSSRVEIQFSTINDSSLNNVVIKDSSIYDSFIMDASLIRCTLYNITTDSSSVTYEDCTTIQYNLVSDCSVVWDEDSSTFYTREIKLVDVGMNGCSTSNIMSAGDYLEWITNNNYWNKFGDMYIWTTAADCPQCGFSKNLIDGFYVYNPQPFDVKIEYMLFI